MQRRGVYEQGEDLKQAADPVAIARARELCRFLRWDAERWLPQLFGQKQQIDVRVETIDLGDRLRRARERVIEGAVQRVSLPVPGGHSGD